MFQQPQCNNKMKSELKMFIAFAMEFLNQIKIRIRFICCTLSHRVFSYYHVVSDDIKESNFITNPCIIFNKIDQLK